MTAVIHQKFKNSISNRKNREGGGWLSDARG